ncbi:MAG: hypothetical protein K9N49_00195 [Candidatus Marinimicrobia bacterium]|nr:hypothetical protein [Candidatus Neomarinimicrobiota bacterium]
MHGGELILLDAEVRQVVKMGVYRVQLENGHELTAFSGPGAVRVADLGERVRMAVAPWDFSRGRLLSATKQMVES